MKKTNTDTFCSMSGSHNHQFIESSDSTKSLTGKKCKWCGWSILSTSDIQTKVVSPVPIVNISVVETPIINIPLVVEPIKLVDSVSIIIPAFQKTELLKITLSALVNQTCKYPIEVIILNDGIEDETELICRQYRERLNIKYVFTGQRNKKELHWRVPGFAINIGVKMAIGNVIIIMCPDIFLLDDCLNNMIEPILKNNKIVTISDGKIDRDQKFSSCVLKSHSAHLNIIYKEMPESLATNLPFFMGISKSEFISIGGYDEDFTGHSWDDNDISERLIKDKCSYLKIDARIVHLYHKSSTPNFPQDVALKKIYDYNKNLYDTRNKLIIRNEGKEWGVCPISEKINSREWFLEKIPKVVHFYWGHPYLPFLNYLSVYTFCKYNPDWKVKFYYPIKECLEQTWTEPCQKFTFTGRDYYEDLRKLPIEFIKFDMESIGISNDIAEVFKSEYMKTYLLSTFGGFWSDMDIIYFKSMAKLPINLPINKEYNTVISLHPKWFHLVGALLSAPNNKFFNYLFEKQKLKHIFNPGTYQCLGAFIINDEFPTAESIDLRFKTTKTIGMPLETFYAYDWAHIKDLYGSDNIRRYNNNSIACHWFGGYEFGGPWINKVNHLTYTDYKVALTKTIELSFLEIQNDFKVIIPTYNASAWIKKCIDSLKMQTYRNFEAIIINDCSTDNTRAIIEQEIKTDLRFKLINNAARSCALENTIKGINYICKDDEDIIVIVDGDDWLAEEDVFGYLNTAYQEDIWTTWGNFKLASTNKMLTVTGTTTPWADDFKGKFIRKELERFLFAHLRTYKYFLFKKIKDQDLKDKNGKYFTVSGDVIIALPIIEMAGEKHRKNIQKIMYCYNDMNQLNDTLLHGKEQSNIFDIARMNMPPYTELGDNRTAIPVIDCLIWTKDRAMQVDLLLRSIHDMFPQVHKVWVRYDYSSANYEKSYIRLIQKKYGINIEYIHKTTCEPDTKYILTQINNDKVPYILCCVDDDVFIRPINDMDSLISCFEEEVTAISLRLSEDITYNYCQNKPCSLPLFLPCKQDFLKWDWKKCDNLSDWGYPAAIDSHIYRTQWFKNIFLNCKFGIPTDMESVMHNDKYTLFKSFLVSGRKSYMLNIPMNRIQTEWLGNRHGNLSPELLNEKFLKGEIVDTSDIYGRECNSVFSEIEFKFIEGPKIKEEWHLSKIPKIAHFYWGNETLPYLRYLTIYSFCKFNPDWKVRVYYPIHSVKKNTWTGPQNKYEFVGGDYWYMLKKLDIELIKFDMETIGLNNFISEIFKSDFLRNHLLSTIGGLWSDMDIIYFKPIGKMSVNISNNKDVTNIICLNETAIGNSAHPQDFYGHSVGFLLSAPDNDYNKFLFKQSKSFFNRRDYQSNGVYTANMNIPNLRSFKNRFPKDKVVNLDMKTVYAYDYTILPKIYNTNSMTYFTSASIGLHWYGGWDGAGKYVNELTPFNYQNYDNVLCKVIALVHEEEK